MNEVRINGMSIVTHGSSIMVSNGRVIIDGTDVTPDAEKISIEIIGNVDSIDVGYCKCVSVTGTAGTIETQSGNVQAGNVTGSVKTMSGNIHCGDVGGSVETMSGSVHHR